MIGAGFLIEVMPRNQQIKRAELLYRHTSQMKQLQSDYVRYERLKKQAQKRAEKEGKSVTEMPAIEFFDAPQRFHSECDGKGATILFVKAN